VTTSAGEKYGEVTMFDLLRESFRQNPTYVIVGETRGTEAYVMFQGMASGHASMSTFHAGSVDAVLKRLTSPPINLSPILIESLNVVTLLSHVREKGKVTRRTKEIVEIISVDPKTDEVKTNLVFGWNPLEDKYEKVNESYIVRKLVESKGGTMEDAIIEIERRTEVLEWLRKQNIKDYLEVTRYINMYYKEPEKLFDLIHERDKKIVKMKTIEKVPSHEEINGGKIEVPLEVPTKKTEVKDKPKRKFISTFDLLGFKHAGEIN